MIVIWLTKGKKVILTFRNALLKRSPIGITVQVFINSTSVMEQMQLRGAGSFTKGEQDLFQEVAELDAKKIGPGLRIGVGGSGAGKSSIYHDYQQIIGQVLPEINDAHVLADCVLQIDHQEGEAQGLLHFHPENVHAHHHVLPQGSTGHTHDRPYNNGTEHFPFEVTNSFITRDQAIELIRTHVGEEFVPLATDMPMPNPIIIATYAAFTRELLAVPLGTTAYVEIAGGVNLLGTVDKDHHMATLDNSYKHLTDIIHVATEASAASPYELQERVGAIISVEAEISERLHRTVQNRGQGEEARTSPLVYVQGRNDAKHTLGALLQRPYIEIKNEIGVTSNQRMIIVAEQLRNALRGL